MPRIDMGIFYKYKISGISHHWEIRRSFAVILITIHIEFTASETAEGNFLANVLILDPP